MKSQNRLLVWLIPVVALLFACSIMPQGTAGTSAAGSTAAAASSVIFQDDFSDKSNDWNSLTDEYGTTDYADSKYLISVANTHSYLYTTPDTLGDTMDVRVEVDVLKSVDTPHDMGILCRFQDADNFYFFLVASDGYYAIGKFKDGEEQLIGSDEMKADDNSVINTGAADNHVRGDCVGDTLTLYANGTKLFQVQDSDFKKGNVGLLAGSYDDAPVSVYFDNFVVTKP